MSILAHFGSDRSGSFNIIFAAALVPMLVGTGSAVDYGRAAGIRAKLQSAADATALALSTEAARRTDPELEAMAIRVFEGSFATTWEDVGAKRKAQGFTRDALQMTRVGKKITVTVSGSIDTSIMKVAGIRTMPLAASSQSVYGMKKIEVALVLDNTGSMSGTKITELRKAATNLVNTLSNAATDPDSVKIGLVPFTTQVRLDTALKGEAFLDFSTNGVAKATWNGCVQDREQAYDTNDDLQKTSPVDLNGKAHPAVQTCAAPTLAPIAPLTNSFSTLKTSIGAMTAGGNTNITIGLAWGLAMLSPGAPLTGAGDFGTPGTEKFMIMLTDGDNTQNRWTSNQSQIDARTTLACNAVKAQAKKITLYTIRVINGNANLLRACATSPAHYKDVQNASQLDAVFQAIAAEIAAVRLTM